MTHSQLLKPKLQKARSVVEYVLLVCSQVGAFRCEVCGEKFTQGKVLRCHLLVTHNKSPDLLCMICHSAMSCAKDLKAHMSQIHGVSDDLLDTLSVGSNESSQTTDGDVELDDCSDNLSVASDGTLPNGRDSMCMDSMDLDEAPQDGKTGGNLPKLESSASINQPQQFAVNS